MTVAGVPLGSRSLRRVDRLIGTSMLRQLLLTVLASLLLVGSSSAAPQGRARQVFETSMAATVPEVPARVRMLRENPEAFYARWWAISQARERLDLSYFGLHEDLFSRALLGLLMQRAREGLPIRLMVDARGSRKLVGGEYLRELAEFENVQVRVFRGLGRKLRSLPWSIRAILASNHEKVLVADGRWVITGGRNTHEKYLAHWRDDPEAYRDTDMLLEGREVAAAVTRAFELEFTHCQNFDRRPRPGWRDWWDEGVELEVAARVMGRWIRGEGATPPGGELAELVVRLNQEVGAHPRLVEYAGFAREPFTGTHVVPTKVLTKRSFGDGGDQIGPALLALIDAAEERVVIQNPYAVLTREVRAAMERAAGRGVEIFFQTNGPGNDTSRLTQAFFLREWKELLRDIPTLRIFMFDGPRVVHAKTMVVDDQVAVVGSYNLDPMSRDINAEVVTVVASGALARRLRLDIERDIARSTEARVEVGDDGEVTPVQGPEDRLKGLGGLWVRVLSVLGFLRPLV